jgi:hypothetical protein
MDELRQVLDLFSGVFVGTAQAAADVTVRPEVDEVTRKIGDFAASVTSYALVLVAVGTVTMALIELVKSVTNARMHFNRWRMRKWFSDEAAHDQLTNIATGSAGDDASSAPIRLITGEIQPKNVLYDQPAEKMMGQIQAAANLALDFPHLYEKAYAFLAGSASTKDKGTWLEYAQQISRGEKPDEATARSATQARARIGALVARKLDNFQNEVHYLWAELNQRAAFIAAACFLLWLMQPEPPAEAFAYLRWIVVAIVGALVAPFAKDLVSGLSSLTSKAK